MRRILAIGGFSSNESEMLAATFIRDLTGKEKPRICLLSTPSGDAPALIHNFDKTYGNLGCETSNVSFLGPIGTRCVNPDDAAAHLPQQDAIFVSGGNPRCALALWNEWGITTALEDAWNRGVLLSGMSAGAICWFDHHVPPQIREPALPLRRFLGFLPGTCGVHYNIRRQHTHDAMTKLRLSSAITIDDDAAILYEDDAIAEVVSWRNGASAYRLEHSPTGIDEHPMTPKTIGTFAVEPARQAMHVEPELKQTYIGRYELMNPMSVVITMEGEQLFAQYGNQRRLEIYPESENRYFFEAVDAQIVFDRDDDGQVTGFTHFQFGRNSRAVKLGEKS